MRNERLIGRDDCAHMTRMTLLSAMLITVLCAAPAAFGQASAKAKDLRTLIGEHLTLNDFDVQALDVPANARGPLRIRFNLDGAPAEMSLQPHSVRSPDFAVYTTAADGRRVRQQTPPSRTFRGSLTGSPDSLVAATLENGVIKALIHYNEELWAIEPVDQELLPGNRNLHVVYRRSDVKVGNWSCGTEHGPVQPLQNNNVDGARGVVSSCIAVAELAIDVDAEYYQLNNSSLDDTTMDIETIINGVNLIYGFQVGIEHLVSELVIFTSIPTDPYSSTSAGLLLDEFQTYRIATPYANPFDIAHLFTGKEIDGGIIGVAWLSAICDPIQQYGLSQSLFTANLLNRIVLTTHELGHNWSARHCDVDDDCGVMCSSVSSCAGPGDVFGDRSRIDIITFRNTVTCLGDGSGTFAAAGTLTASVPPANAGLGFGVAVDIDGSIAVVGAYQDDEFAANAGAAYIYEFDGDQWLEQKILPNPEDHAAGDRFGVSVAIDTDDTKTTVVVGAYLDTGMQGNSGSVYVFRKVKDVWTQIQKLTRPVKVVGDLFGFSVDISGDYIIVGTPFDNTKGSDAGTAFVFRDTGIEFELIEQLTAGPLIGGNQDQYGYSVGIISDPQTGIHVVVGSPFEDEQATNGGAFFTYYLDTITDTWITSTSWFGLEFGAQLGNAVAISKDRLAAGSWQSNTIAFNAGAVYMFELGPNNQGWGPLGDVVTDPDLTDNANFGSSVDIDNDVLVVGAYLDDINGSNEGAVYSYRFNGTDWVSVGRFEPADQADGDQLGLSVGLSGDLAIGGAWKKEGTLAGEGASYIFIIAPDPTDCDGSGIPDTCEIASGVLPDCNNNNVPDECDIAMGTSPDVDLNGIPDGCDFDCNGNGITDSTEIADGSAADCNENGFPDSCDLDPTDPDGNGMVSTDVDMDGIPDECSPDCNGNGIPDSTDITGGGSFDCNMNGVPDECDRMDYMYESAPLGPVGAFDTQTVTLDLTTEAPPWALGDVAVTVIANADIDLNSEYIRLYLDGDLMFEIFRSGAIECPVDGGLAPDVETRFIPADDWNRAIRRDNQAVLLMEPNGSVNAGQCAGGSWVQVSVSYASGDCNNNNMLDFCEIANGMATDCNGNGVPDSCELALFDCNNNGVPDDCDIIPADIDSSGAVDIFDLLAILSAWGPCPGCPEDIVVNNAVDVFDLLEVLIDWNACP